MVTRQRVPTLHPEQARALARLLAEEYHVSLLQTLENSGRALAELARGLLEGEIADRPIVVLAGRGNNGAGGLAAARHLLNWGAWVQVVCSHDAAAYAGEPAQQLAALQAMGAALAWAEDGWELPPCDLLIDAVIGSGLHGAPREPARYLIQLANSNAAPILSLDAPSGVDLGTGTCCSPHVQAAATLVLGLPLSGLREPQGAMPCGELFLADIGVPAALYVQLDVDAPLLFARNAIVPLHVEQGEIWAEE